MRDSPLADLEVKVQREVWPSAMEQEHRHSENLIPKREEWKSFKGLVESNHFYRVRGRSFKVLEQLAGPISC